MDLRSHVKNVLRMCGHAVVSTVHDRLNGIERALRDILDENTELARTQTALLQSGLHVVEKIAKIEEDVRRLELGRRTTALNSEGHFTLAAITRILQQIEASQGETAARIEAGFFDTVAPAVEKMVAVSDGMRQTTAASLGVLEPWARRTLAFLSNESARQVCLETSDYVATNPELGLLRFLYSFLPSRRALDVGAHAGEVSNFLLKAGYEVYAFEPCPATYNRLQSRLGAVPEFHSFPFAIGSVDGQQPLYYVEDRSPDKIYGDPSAYFSLSRHGMPADLPFQGESVEVPVRTLASLHAEGLLPEDIELVKIDTEGFDLEVIRGMRQHQYSIVMAEFWDSAIPFGRGGGVGYTAESMVAEMRERGYLWYIVLYRVWGEPRTAFFCNHDRAVQNSWGNMIFFRDREIFVEAQQWCAAVLPRTYFKPIPAHVGDAAKIER